MKNWRNYFHNYSLVSIPTRTNFRSISEREIFIFEGPAGLSEFSPFLEYGAKESANWARAALEAAYWAKPNESRKVLVNATLPIVPIEQVAGILGNFPGVKTIKVKINSFAEERELVAKAIETIPEAKIRLDVNGGWDLAQSITNLSEFAEAFGEKIEYVEQPVTQLNDLAKLQELNILPIAIDESIRKNLENDFSGYASYADYAILKWQPVGGFNAAAKIKEAIKLPTIISSALESGIGIYHGIALAAQIGTPELAAGLGTVNLLTGDILENSPRVIDGEIAYQRPILDLDRVNYFTAPKSRLQWWEERIDVIWEKFIEPDKWGWDFL